MSNYHGNRFLSKSKYLPYVPPLVATQPVLKKVSKLFIHLYQQKLNIKPQFSLENHQSFKRQLAQSNWIIWIGIHVRRSDFIPRHYSSSHEYLFTAIEYRVIQKKLTPF